MEILAKNMASMSSKIRLPCFLLHIQNVSGLRDESGVLHLLMMS